MTAEIARRVPSGHVLGVDSSEDLVELAQQTCGPAIPNVEFCLADARALICQMPSITSSEVSSTAAPKGLESEPAVGQGFGTVIAALSHVNEVKMGPRTTLEVVLQPDVPGDGSRVSGALSPVWSARLTRSARA